MSNQNIKIKQGFTIIEVVLVLAIAGLIFLMVFIALPQLQKSQRDTQRRSDLTRVATALTQYQTNNNGKLPASGKGVGGGMTEADIASHRCYGDEVKNLNPSSYNGTNKACEFIARYLNSSSATTNEFIDPDGTVYSLSIMLAPSSYAVGDNHTISRDDSQDDYHAIKIRVKAKCGDYEGAYIPTGRYGDYAILRRLEGSGAYYCVDNQ